MITPMKKVTILTVADAVEQTLTALRSLEILHLTPLQAAAGAKLNQARGEMTRVQKVLETVPDKAPKGVKPVDSSADSAKDLIEEVHQLIAESKQAEIDKDQAEDHLPLGIRLGALIGSGARDGARGGPRCASALAHPSGAAVGAARAQGREALAAAPAFHFRDNAHCFSSIR